MRGMALFKDRHIVQSNGKVLNSRSRHSRGGSSTDIRINAQINRRNYIIKAGGALLCTASMAILLIITLLPDWMPLESSQGRTVLQLIPPILKDISASAGRHGSASVSRIPFRPHSSTGMTALELNEEVAIDSISMSPHVKDVHKVELSTGYKDNPLGLSHGMKVFIYDLPPSFNKHWLLDHRCSDHLFAAEVAVHQRLLTSPIRTLHPNEADFFFMPVYVTCNFSSTTGFPVVGHARSLLKSAVKLVSHEMPYWNRSGGRDHVFVATHDYGPCFHTMEDLAVTSGIPMFLRNSTILQTFGQTNKHVCQADNNIQIPPYVPPSILKPDWHPEQHRRDIFVYFRGKMELHPKNFSGRLYSRGVRSTIWKRFRHNRRFFVERSRSADYYTEIGRSVFCLCPLGWAPWSPRIVESVILGCVPVIIADNIALPYSHFINWSKISLTVPEKDVRKLGKILDKVSRTNLSVIQGNLWNTEYRKALLYMDPLTIGDATWQILELLSRKIPSRSSRLTQ